MGLRLRSAQKLGIWAWGFGLFCLVGYVLSSTLQSTSISIIIKMQCEKPTAKMLQSDVKTQCYDLRTTKSGIRKRRNNMRQQTVLQIRKDLLQKFQQFKAAQSYKKVRQIFQNSVGRHTPLNCKQVNYQIKQQWQVSNKIQTKQQLKSDIFHFLLNFILLLIINACILLLSIKVVFPIENTKWVYYLVAAICFVSILQNFIIRTTKTGGASGWAWIIGKDGLCIFIMILIPNVEDYVDSIQVLAVIVVVVLYLKGSKIYMYIKIFNLSSKYREIVEIFDLFILLLTISHIFALLLYATTKLHPNNNWLSRINLQDGSWHTEYIYSLYFSCTTLLTVGYGDISPTNVAEILMILLVQFFGIAAFAYAVNKIGAALANITERAQKLQKDLSNVQYIGNQFKLRPELVCRMRTELVKEKNLESELNLAEENQLFARFSEDLRERISLESSMRVIKRSMFMIGNWTGKLQAKIAMKLVKQIYAVESFLPQTPGKQRIYILDKGKLEIVNNTKSGHKLIFQKVLKTLSVKLKTEVVVQNVYGYSFVISGRPIKLNAIAKSNCICYSLSKADMFELLAESQEDQEHFHQLKAQIDFSKIPENFEVPSIVNIREHYCPSPFYIISKYSNKKTKNGRGMAIRGKRRVKMLINSYSTEDEHMAISQNICRPARKSLSPCIHFQSGKLKESDIDRHQVETNRVSDAHDEDGNENINVQKINEEIEGFEACKEYQRYFKKQNFQQVVKRMKSRIWTKQSKPLKVLPKHILNMTLATSLLLKI